MYERVCVACEAVYARHAQSPRQSFCWECFEQHAREGRLAITSVLRAVQRGEFPPAKQCECADCGRPARDYDHRDYTRPLDVTPVCRGCNQRRGPAFNSFWRPESLHPPMVACESLTHITQTDGTARHEGAAQTSGVA